MYINICPFLTEIWSDDVASWLWGKPGQLTGDQSDRMGCGAIRAPQFGNRTDGRSQARRKSLESHMLECLWSNLLDVVTVLDLEDWLEKNRELILN